MFKLSKGKKNKKAKPELTDKQRSQLKKDYDEMQEQFQTWDKWRGNAQRKENMVKAMDIAKDIQKENTPKIVKDLQPDQKKIEAQEQHHAFEATGIPQAISLDDIVDDIVTDEFNAQHHEANTRNRSNNLDMY